MNALLAALRQRKVVQWGIAYAAGAWGLLQGLAYITDTFHWPEQIQQLATLALLVGLPVVLVLAWFHGDRGHRRVTRTELAILTVLFLLGGGLFWRYQRTSETMPPVATPVSSVPAVASPMATAAPNEKSIAVLPFADMSAEKNQEYMSDGMAEELLNLLAQVPDLKVIARTSSFAFKGKDVPIAEIARQLNVAHVVEGSIRKSGNTLRITAQLIRTADSTQLWSETYDRPLDDIFAVQDEIANAIVQALQIKLMGGNLSSREGGTQNLEAYQLYLRAVSANFQNTRSSLDAAGEYLEQAIKLDPDYGLAWSQLSEISVNKADQGLVNVTEGYERARRAAQRAAQLSPELAEARARLQYVHVAFDWDWVAAEADGRQALAITTTDPEVLNTAGVLSYVLGRWDNAERQLRAALVRDPLNTYAMWNLGFTYYGAGRFADSEGVYRKLLEIQPDFVWGHNYLGLTLLAQGNAEEALAVVQQQVDDGERLKVLPIVLQAAGRPAESDEALRAQIARWANTGAFYVAMTYAYRGDHDHAIEWLERAYQQKDTWLATTITGEQLFKGMADDPRYKALLRKLNLPESPPPATDLKKRKPPS
jgi:TolB-like protein/Flp pilus assembly protein TadD